MAYYNPHYHFPAGQAYPHYPAPAPTQAMPPPPPPLIVPREGDVVLFAPSDPIYNASSTQLQVVTLRHHPHPKTRPGVVTFIRQDIDEYTGRPESYIMVAPLTSQKPRRPVSADSCRWQGKSLIR